MHFLRRDGADPALVVLAVGTDRQRIAYTHPQGQSDVAGIRPCDADIRFVKFF